MLTIQVPSERDSFSGVSTGQDTEMDCYFVQQNTSNSTLDLNPNLVSTYTLLISPLDEAGDELVDFEKIITNKAANVIYEKGTFREKIVSIDKARLTLPDGVTPILARIVIGG